MKRSPLPPRTAPLKRGARPKVKRATPRKVSVDRNPEYLAWLRERRCVACAQLVRSAIVGPWPLRYCGATEAAHGPVNGIGSKGSDIEAVPLGRLHHIEQHRVGWSAFEAKHGFSREKEAAAHYLAFRIERGEIQS